MLIEMAFEMNEPPGYSLVVRTGRVVGTRRYFNSLPLSSDRAVGYGWLVPSVPSVPSKGLKYEELYVNVV